MKKTVFNLHFILALIAVTLAGLTTRTRAATFPNGSYVNYFSSSSDVLSWLYWYDTPGGNLPMSIDPSTADPSAAPFGYSLIVDNPFSFNTPSDPGTNQDVFFGTFGNTAQYDDSVQVSLNKFDYIQFDVYVNPINPNNSQVQQTNSDGNYGSLEVGVVGNAGAGWPRTWMGTVTIPAAATNYSHWQTLSVPINHALGDLSHIAGIVFNYNNYNGYPTNDFVFWIGHLVMHYNPNLFIGPPTMSLSTNKPVVGLNLIDTQPANNYNRYQVETATSTGYGFVDQPNVTYSWNIKSFPTNSPNGFQQHFFIVNGNSGGRPGPYDQAADWNLPNCIFITVQADSNNFAYMNFRYKTNEPAGNGMIYNTATNNANGWPVEPVGSLYTSNYSPLGTWSVTFNNQTNVTLTAPHGETTNFVFDPASAAVFADPATVILGAQPNDTFVGGEAVVYSSFSVTGNDSPFTDIFTNDSQLNTNYWNVLANDPNGVVLVPPSAAYWLTWTLPDAGFGLQSSANLADPNSWQDTVALQQIQNNTNRAALLGANNLPSANQGYYRLLQRTPTQLQVLLPGETNAPDTPTGKIGTPNPSSYSQFQSIPVTVNLCDSTWHIVNVTGDVIYIYSNEDPSFYNPGNVPIVNGTAQWTDAEFQGNTTNMCTIRAGDATDTNITQGVSSIITVN